MGRNMLECWIACLRLEGGQENGRQDIKRRKGRDGGSHSQLRVHVRVLWNNLPSAYFAPIPVPRALLSLLYLVLTASASHLLLLLFPLCK